MEPDETDEWSDHDTYWNYYQKEQPFSQKKLGGQHMSSFYYHLAVFVFLETEKWDVQLSLGFNKSLDNDIFIVILNLQSKWYW